MIAFSRYISRRWLVLTGKLIGITVVSGLCLVYLTGKISHTSGAIEQSRSMLGAFHARHDKLEQLKKDWEIIEPHLSRLAESVPSVNNFPVVSSYIASVATKTSNAVNARYDSIPVLNELGVHELGFSFQINGSLSTIHAFLAELEKAPYFIDVRSLSITLTAGLEGQANAEANGAIYLTETSL